VPLDISVRVPLDISVGTITGVDPESKSKKRGLNAGPVRGANPHMQRPPITVAETKASSRE